VPAAVVDEVLAKLQTLGGRVSTFP
jgi:hypothetical protein